MGKNCVKSICSVEVYPKHYKLDGLKSFRDSVEEYFENRKDVIKRVIKCEAENYGNNVRLVVEVNVERGQIYSSSVTLKRTMLTLKSSEHACQDHPSVTRDDERCSTLRGIQTFTIFRSLMAANQKED